MSACRRVVLWASLASLLLAACSSPEEGGGTASIPREQATQSTGAEPSASPSMHVPTGKPSVDPSVSASAVAQPSPSSTPTPVVKGLDDYRASGLWHDLGTAAQAGGVVQRVMQWRNPQGVVGSIPNADALWGQIMPPLRDHLLARHINEGAIPTPVFAGMPYQAAQAVRVVTWWTNGPGGTGGRGQMLLVTAGWKSAQGVDHIDMWPVLIGFGAGGEGQMKAGRVNAIGPMHTLPVAQLDANRDAAFAAISAHFHPWMQQQPITEDPLDLPCPQAGCTT